MCVIAAKPKGIDMMSDEYIQNMWDNNDDGAGFMYADGKDVHISKGYMKFADFKQALKDLGEKVDLKNTALVLHFRIGTAGGNIPANTHPFPITDNVQLLQKLNVKTKLGIAHNGIINIKTHATNISDTMEYIVSRLSLIYRENHEFYKSPNIMKLILNATSSKWAFLTPDGTIYTIGDFTEEEGILYSNLTYSYSGWYTKSYTGVYSRSKYPNYSSIYPYDGWGYADTCIVSKRMMWLRVGDFIYDMTEGKYYDVSDFNVLLSEDDELCWYDDYMQDAVCLDGDFIVYDKDGRVRNFDPDRAFVMQVSYGDDMSLKDVEPTIDDYELISLDTDDDAPKGLITGPTE